MAKKNFINGYLKHEDVSDWNTGRELDRQHNIGLLKGIVVGIVSMILSYYLFY